MWPWCKMNDEELEAVTGGDIPGLEAIGPCAIAGGVIGCSDNNELHTPHLHFHSTREVCFCRMCGFFLLIIADKERLTKCSNKI